MGVILAVAVLVSAFVVARELRKLTQAVETAVKELQETAFPLIKASRVYFNRNQARQSTVKTRDSQRRPVEIDAQPARQRRLRITHVDEEV